LSKFFSQKLYGLIYGPMMSSQNDIVLKKAQITKRIDPLPQL